MRKKLLIFLTFILMLTGCNTNQDRTLDLEKLNAELPYLSDDTFNILNVLNSVEYEKENLFENLIDVYDYDYEKLGISNDHVAHGTIRISPTSVQMYMVFKPKDGKEEALIDELNAYLEKRKAASTNETDLTLLDNALIEETEDFIALIVSKDNREVLKRIQNSKTHIFEVLTPATGSDLESYGISLDWIEEFAVQKPVLTCSKTYMILKPKEGKEEDVKNALNQYLKQLATGFISMPKELEFIENAMVTEFEGYQIVIISNNNEKVFEAIQTYVQK